MCCKSFFILFTCFGSSVFDIGFKNLVHSIGKRGNLNLQICVTISVARSVSWIPNPWFPRSFMNFPFFLQVNEHRWVWNFVTKSSRVLQSLHPGKFSSLCFLHFAWSMLVDINSSFASSIFLWMSSRLSLLLFSSLTHREGAGSPFWSVKYSKRWQWGDPRAYDNHYYHKVYYFEVLSKLRLNQREIAKTNTSFAQLSHCSEGHINSDGLVLEIV